MKLLNMKVVSNREVAEGYFLLEFKSETAIPPIYPGTFVMLSFPDRTDPLLPRPMGVFKVLDNDDASTSFSIGYVVVGKGTYLMSRLRPGEEMRCLAPLGNGWDMDEVGRTEKVILVAGGIGITPLFEAAKTAMKRKKSTILLLGGRVGNDLVFYKDFEKLGVEIILFTEDGSVGKKGLVSGGLKSELTDNCFLLACGPEGMLRAVWDICRKNGIDPQLSFDKRMGCGFGVCLGCNISVTDRESGEVREVRVCKEGPVFKGSDISW
jgi:dihydroorotate dehydrogenase electron transfer subunit